jgi:hypothetical protein
MSRGESSLIVAVGGITLPAMRLSVTGDTTDTDILAAKVETTTRMGKVGPPARAGTIWRVVTIIANLIGSGA